MRKEIREELNIRSDAKGKLVKGLRMSDEDFFILHANQLWYLDKMRMALVNQTRSAIVESIIKDSSFYSKIVQMRRNQTVNKKNTAKLIKKALAEQLKIPIKEVEGEITTMRDNLLDQDKVYHAFDITKDELAKKLKPYLETQPIYINWLNQIKGIDVLSASKLLRLVGDITRFSTPSALWHYAGLHVVKGRAPKPKHGQAVTWNPKLRALLLGIMGENFIKQNNIYRKVYDNRASLTKRTKPQIWHLNPNGTKLTTPNKHPKHGHKDAIRVMMKRFLLEFWIASYQAKGLQPPTQPYSSRFHPNQPFKPIFPYKPSQS